MGKRGARSKRNSKVVTAKEVIPEFKEDAEARNVLMNQPELTLKNSKKPMKGIQLKKYLKTTLLYGKKHKQRKYSEKELEIPVLNESVNPGAIKKKGKKGKKFVADNDIDMMNRLINQINDSKDKADESKLEREKRMEDIRELRKKEIEKREEQKKQELEEVKKEIRSKASLARSERRKSAKIKKHLSEHNNKRPKKKVTFA